MKVLPSKKVQAAYFSMEIGLRNDLPTYSGGLGILAGDTLKSAADLAAPIVAVSLLYNKGYFIQSLDDQGNQREQTVVWDPHSLLTLLPERIVLTIDSRQVQVQAWKYSQMGVTGHELPIFFLDTNLPENTPVDREITSQLYGGDLYQRLAQEIVLGLGGIKMLDALGYADLETYHMNEGHAAFLTLELLPRYNWQDTEVRKRCIFTTHTPVPAGHDEFPYDLVYKVMGTYVPWHIKELAGQHTLNMTILALNMSRFANGVAKKHGEVSRNMFPDFDIDAITNGVHSTTWTTESFQKVFDQYVPQWRLQPELLVHAAQIPDEVIWQNHQNEKQRLFDYVKKTTGVELDPNVLTLGFARRSATYKRGDLIFADMERLTNICKGKVQLVFAGKAHPKDIPGKEVIRKIYQVSKQYQQTQEIKMVFLPNYCMELGLLLTAGVDVWLNTPIRPREASGTSGMKSVHNAVPNFSVLDGWWIEGCVEGITGWAIGPEAKEANLIENNNSEDVESFYQKLETQVIPTYYNNRQQWTSIMKQAIVQNASYFNTHRMLKEYLQRAYCLEGVVFAQALTA